MMKHLTYLHLMLFLCSCACGRNSQSISNDAMAQYRDTIVGKFNGMDIDTLISEPIDTIKERAFWDWRIYSKNNTVDTLILTQRFMLKMIQEGDLDGNGTDEFGVRRETDSGTWDNYYIYTFHNGEWQYLIEPIDTYSNHFYNDLNNGVEVVERANHSDFVKVRFSYIRNDDFCLVDTLIHIASLHIKQD